MSTTAYFWDPICLEHDTGAHVETIDRARRLSPDVIRKDILNLDHRPITDHEAAAWICRVHDPAYHDFVRDACANGSRCLDHGDTVVSRSSYDAACAAVNAALSAGDVVANGGVNSAFVATRPPGHHCLAAEAMGFCLFANVVILTRYLQQEHGMERIAVVDWDVHHGNGTQHFFYDDPDVLFISLHQDPLWPGSGKRHERGEGRGEGTTLNLPIRPHTPEDAYLEIFEQAVVPAVDAFKPQAVLISAGFDAHHADPLAQLSLTESGFARLTECLKDVAWQHCGGRIIACLEGGYNLDALQKSVVTHVRTLMA